MGSITQGAALKQARGYSRFNPARIGGIIPEEVITFRQLAAGAASYVAYMVPGNGKLRLEDVRARWTTPGTNPILLKIHKGGVVAAPTAASSGTDIWLAAQIATTGAANTWQKIGSGVTWGTNPATGVDARILTPGSTLVIAIPATVVDAFVQVLGIWV